MLVPLALAIATAEAAYGGFPFADERKPYPQELSDHRNLLKYHGGKGPYVDRRSYGISRDPPLGCEVDQVIILNRHGERWPSHGDYKSQLKSLKKVQALKGNLTGSLEFANWWEPFITEDSGWYGEESLVGPYSGLLDAYKYGTETRRRYGYLYDGESQLPIFSSAYERVVDTARKFGEGFLNWNYTDLAALNLIQETADQGANTLTPSCTFKDNRTSTTCNLPKNGSDPLYPEFFRAASRLNAENPGLELTAADIPQLISLVAWELNVRGSSPWTDVFTAEEFVAFEYQVTTGWYCSTGPGSTNGLVEGSVYINATRTLLRQGPEQSLPLVFSFAHDTNLMQAITALGIDEPKSEWDAQHVRFGQNWDVTDLVPQGAHFVLERLVCSQKPGAESAYRNKYPAAFPDTPNGNRSTNGTSTKKSKKSSKAAAHANGTSSTNSTNSTSDIYVRVVLNEAVVPLDGCSTGPGFSCQLDDYNSYVNKRLQNVSYVKECKQPAGSPTYLSFFWDYNHTNALNPAPSVLPFRAEELTWNGTVLQD